MHVDLKRFALALLDPVVWEKIVHVDHSSVKRDLEWLFRAGKQPPCPTVGLPGVQYLPREVEGVCDWNGRAVVGHYDLHL